jgi:glycosyltransferase involved in cell wall biosynthesis
MRISWRVSMAQATRHRPEWEGSDNRRPVTDANSISVRRFGIREPMGWPDRILHVAPFLWSGAGRVIVRLAQEQARSSTVMVTSSARVDALRDWPPYRRALAPSGVAFGRIDFFRRSPEHFWPATDQLAQAIEAFAPSIVHVHSGVPACACAVLRDRGAWRGPTIAHLNSWAPRRPAWMDRMDMWGLARADLVVCTSSGYRSRLRALGVPATKLRLVPWGVDVPAATASRAASAGRVIGVLGRIEPRKRQHVVVQALAHLRTVYPDARLELIGPIADPVYAERVRSEIERLALAAHVRLSVAVPDPTSRMRRWAVAVSASEDEGQGLAVLEAMALAVPVVACRAAGVDDSLRHGQTGLLVDGRPSARRLAAAIGASLRDRAIAQRMAAAARHVVRRRFAWASTFARLGRLYGLASRRALARTPRR